MTEFNCDLIPEDGDRQLFGYNNDLYVLENKTFQWHRQHILILIGKEGVDAWIKPLFAAKSLEEAIEALAVHFPDKAVLGLEVWQEYQPAGLTRSTTVVLCDRDFYESVKAGDYRRDRTFFTDCRQTY